MYSNIKVYQKYLVTSIKVGYATRSLYASSGPKAEGVPTNNQRGRGSWPCRLWGGLDKARHIVPTALLVRVQRFRNDLYKAVKGPSTRPIVLLMIEHYHRCIKRHHVHFMSKHRLMKHYRRRQGPAPRSLWLIFETPSVLGRHEFAYRLRLAWPILENVTVHILLECLNSQRCLRVAFLWLLLSWVCCCSSVYIRLIIY